MTRYRYRAVLLLFLLLNLTACQTWQSVSLGAISPAQLIEEDQPDRVRVTGGGVLEREVVSPSVEGDQLLGAGDFSVPLEDILPIVYEANVGALVMEMANPRHAHEYKVYQRFPLPEHMLLVAGVIDTKTNYVEHPEVVADRLRLAVDAVGGDPTRVMAGTDCGFDTSAGSNRVDKDIVWLKLAAMRDGANLASQSYTW